MPPDPSSPPSLSHHLKSAWPILRRLGPAGVLAVVAATLPAIAGFALMAFTPSVSHWLRAQGPITGPVLYALAFGTLSGFALFPTYAQAALGGFAFGLLNGSLAALAGCLLGAILGYEIARRASGDRVMQILREHPPLAVARDALVGSDPTAPASPAHTFWRTVAVVALLRVSPSSPFALTNILLASLQVPRLSFVLGTLVGMLPRTVGVVYLGVLVAHTSASFSGEAAKKAQPVWVVPVGVVLVFVALFVIKTMAERAIKRMRTTTKMPA